MCRGAVTPSLGLRPCVRGGMARRGLLPTQFRVRPVGSLPVGMQPLVGKSGEFRPVPAAAGHRVSAQALATASILAAFVCLATFDSEAFAADSGSGSGSGSGSRTQYTKSSESPLPPRLSTWTFSAASSGSKTRLSPRRMPERWRRSERRKPE